MHRRAYFNKHIHMYAEDKLMHCVVTFPMTQKQSSYKHVDTQYLFSSLQNMHEEKDGFFFLLYSYYRLT